MNYRVFLSVDCDDNDDATETANDSLSLEAIIYVPLEGTPNVTIVSRGGLVGALRTLPLAPCHQCSCWGDSL